jgi:hypothetical protein
LHLACNGRNGEIAAAAGRLASRLRLSIILK